MPRYFFDITDSVRTVDHDGIECSNAHAARDMGLRTLLDVARDEIGRRDGRAVRVLMRDEAGSPLFSAALSLSARWLVDTV